LGKKKKIEKALSTTTREKKKFPRTPTTGVYPLGNGKKKSVHGGDGGPSGENGVAGRPKGRGQGDWGVTK